MKLHRRMQTGIWTPPARLSSTRKNNLWLVILLFLPYSENSRKVLVPSFWGDDKVLMDPTDAVKLDWFVEPGNTSVSWVRCYQGNGRNPSNHFLSYHFNSQKKFLGGPLEGRTDLCPFNNRDDTPFAIRILLMGPKKPDTGCFTCEIDVGGSDPLEAKLMLRVYGQGTNEVSTLSANVNNSGSTSGNMTESRHSEKLDHEVRVNRSEWTELEIGLLCGLGALVLIFGVFAFVFAYKHNFFRQEKKLKSYSSISVIPEHP